jgi:hypothetical protein
MRTKIEGAKVITVGSDLKACHGNEPGTLKEVVSLNTGGPTFMLVGAPTVFVEMGMQGITGSPGMKNRMMTGGGSGSASGAGGGAGGGGGGGGGAGGGGGGGPSGPEGGGGGGGGTSTGAGASSPGPTKEERRLAAEPGDTPAHRAAREKVAKHWFESNKMGEYDYDTARKGIDFSKPVVERRYPPPSQLHQYVRKSHGQPGNWFDPKGGQTGDQLGLNTDPAHRHPRTFNVPPGGQRTALESTAAPITDDWTDRTTPVATRGGGTQWTVPHDDKSAIATHNPL